MSDTRFQLDPDAHKTIYEKIELDHFRNAQPVDNPRAIILGGQTGAGKSRLLQASQQEFTGGDVVSINGDDLRQYHPRLEEILKSDEQRFAELTDPDVRPWTEKLFTRAIETHRNIVCEGTMRVSSPIMETMNWVQERIRRHRSCDGGPRAIQPRQHHLRYEQRRAEKGFGRATAVATHDESYKGMPATIEEIKRYKRAGRVEVYDRKN